MGASGWQTSVPWQPDLARALAVARANEYAQIAAPERERAAAMPVDQLLLANDIAADDDPDTYEEWSHWVDEAPPETRYALACGLEGTHSILDIDHVAPDRGTRPAAALRVELRSTAGLILVPPTPGLGAVRWATRDELLARYETEHPDTVGGDDDVWDHLDRGEAVAVTRWQGDHPVEIVFFGVTGD